MPPITTIAGITTVPSRRKDLFPRTLESLRQAVFTDLRIFLDNATLDQGRSYEQEFHLPVTVRNPGVLTFGNWCLGLAELYLRNPSHINRYAMFQDDFVTYRKLKNYLDQCKFPDKGYWNLYTFPQNQELAGGRQGWFESNQRGKGAVALMFNQPGVIDLLTSLHMVRRPQDAARGWKSIDGGIVEGMREKGYKEYCHSPSLVQHTGILSTMRNPVHPQAPVFLGEQTDATILIPKEGS